MLVNGVNIHVCAYLSIPFLGSIWVERGGPGRGRCFFDCLAEGDDLTVFVGKWSFVLDQMPRDRRLAWLALVAPTLGVLAVAKAALEATALASHREASSRLFKAAGWR